MPQMDYLIRLAQTHESFRRPEIEALSRLANLQCEIVSYSADSPFCIVHFPSLDTPHRQSEQQVDEIVRAFESRAILSRGIYELWGQGRTYDELNADVRKRSGHLWENYEHASFKFWIDCYGSTRDSAIQRVLIDSFSYLGFQGKIRMKNPDAEFAVMEEWIAPNPAIEVDRKEAEISDPFAGTNLKRIFLGRKLGESRRHLKEKHDLKKRPYISTTSMDAELALVTANVALAAPGKTFLDPFVGTGGFMVAAAELGAVVFGSDIDGRSFRGKGAGLELGTGANFKKYSLQHLFGDCITSDLTNTPFRNSALVEQTQDDRWLDGIICDPPYGVREGLKVLGTRNIQFPSSPTNGESSKASLVPPVPEVYLIDGIPAHTLPGYIAPKKPYSFTRMLDDILTFAARTLVDGGRLAFWMPSANENESGEEEATLIPTHRFLELKHECIQRFNKWSRRLLVYERVSGRFECGGLTDIPHNGGVIDSGYTADELNPFRKRYFQPVVDRNGGCIT